MLNPQQIARLKLLRAEATSISPEQPIQGPVGLDETSLERLTDLTQRAEPAKQQPEETQGLISQALESVGGAISSGAESVGEFFTGSDRETRATRELPELGFGGLLAGEPVGQAAKFAALLAVTPDPQELADILQAQFPSILLQQDESGNIIATNANNGAAVVINKPGFSKLDAAQIVGSAAAFAPGAGASTAVKGLFKKAAVDATTAAATEGVIQGAQEASGGQFDVADVVIAGAAGGIGEGSRGALDVVRRNKRGVIPRDVQDALKVGQVLSSDINPPKTFTARIAQKISERIPFVGTGGLRVGQQESRQDAVSGFLADFDVDTSQTFGATITKALQERFKARSTVARSLRGRAIDQLAELGGKPTPQLQLAIDRELARNETIGALGDVTLAKTLSDIADETLDADFEKLSRIRTALFDLQKDVGAPGTTYKSGAEAALSNLTAALSKDMTAIAQELPAAAKDWRRSNIIFRNIIKTAKDTNIAKILAKGDVTPEAAEAIVKTGKLSDLRRLNKNVDEGGRAAIRQQILKQAMEASTDGELLNPSKFIKHLDKRLKAQTDIFFSGAQQRQLEGLKRFIRLTERAQTANLDIASRQEVSLLIAGVTGSYLGAAAIPAGVLLGVGGRFTESAKVRDFLLRLQAAPPGSGAEKKALQALEVAVGLAGRTAVAGAGTLTEEQEE